MVGSGGACYDIFFLKGILNFGRMAGFVLYEGMGGVLGSRNYTNYSTLLTAAVNYCWIHIIFAI